MPGNKNAAGTAKRLSSTKKKGINEGLPERTKDRIFDGMLEVQDRIGRQLASAAPECPAGSLTACVAALWEVSSLHQHCIARLLQMEFPHDIEALSQWTSEVEVNWLSAASGYLQELRTLLPEFRGCLGEAQKQRGDQAK